MCPGQSDSVSSSWIGYTHARRLPDRNNEAVCIERFPLRSSSATERVCQRVQRLTRLPHLWLLLARLLRQAQLSDTARNFHPPLRHNVKFLCFISQAVHLEEKNKERDEGGRRRSLDEINWGRKKNKMSQKLIWCLLYKNKEFGRTLHQVYVEDIWTITWLMGIE